MNRWTIPKTWRGKWQVLAVVELGILLCSIDGTIVVLALPTIAKAFGQSIAAIQWVSVAYTITCAATLSLAGKWADTLGRKTAYLTGFAILTTASLAAGLASNFEWLVATRVFTAFGTAFLLSSSNAILSSVFPKEQRGLVLGLGVTVFSIGVAAGLSIGGAILHFASWRWIFFVNFPIGIFALAAGALVFDPNAIGPARPRTKPVDWSGSVLVIVTLFGFLLGLQRLAAGEAGQFVVLEVTATVAAYFFIRTERRAADPILPPWLFGVSEIFRGSITRVIMRMATAGVSFTLPFYLQFNLGLSAAHAGLIMLAYVAVLAVAGPVSGHLADRFSPRPVLLAGLIFLGLGLGLLFLLPGGRVSPVAGAIAWVVIAQGIMGLGTGMFGSPNAKSAMESVSREHHTVVSGLLWTTTFIGQALGTTAAALLLGGSSSVAGAPLQNQQQVFALLAAFVAGAFGLCLWSKPAPDLTKSSTDPGRVRKVQK